jgi:hypothetical protein
MQPVIIIGVSTMTNKRIVKLPSRDASSDKFDYAYDYNYYITEDNNYYNDLNSN